MARQSERHVLWAPVAFIAGIGGYFSLPIEPAWPVFAVTGLAGLAIAALRLCARAPFVIFMAGMCAMGFTAAKLKSTMVATPVLAASTGSVAITGRIKQMELVSTRRARFYIQLESASGIKPSALPELIRITGKKPPRFLLYGERISARARLFTLPTPVMPGGFDFARRLWFEGVGATGFILGDIKVIGRRDISGTGRAISYLQQLRYAMESYILDALPGKTGVVAAALITGARGGVDEKTRDILQAAGLAHILAISGLHMTLVAGGVFWLFRALLALSPRLVLDYPIKKWAAVAGILAAVFYLFISGAAISTQRSFIMLTIMFAAVLLDRPAISLRNVAIAAMIIASMNPESVVGPGFQMSFLAVSGLIGAHETIQSWRVRQRVIDYGINRNAVAVAGYFAAIAVTTIIASIYTGLPAAFHFNRVAVYGLAGNLVALPVFSLLVMPMAIISVLAMPFGLEAAPLSVMGRGIEIILDWAGTVANWPDSRLAVASMETFPVLVLVLGLLWLVLWCGRLQLAGFGLMLIGALLLSPERQPDILVSKFGRNVAVAGIDGKLVPADSRKSRFAVEKWLQSSGEIVKPSRAAERGGWHCKNKLCTFFTKGYRIGYLKRGIAPDNGVCAEIDIVIAEIPLRRKCKGRVLTIDRFDLWAKGAHAIFLGKKTVGPKMRTAKDLRGKRPWGIAPVPRKSIRLPTVSPD